MQSFQFRSFTKSAQILGKIYVLDSLPYSYFGEVVEIFEGGWDPILWS